MFYSGAKEAFSAEGWRYGECPRCSVAGAWSSVGGFGLLAIGRRRVGNISTVGDRGWLYWDNVHGLLPLGANIVIFECIVHKAINPVCNTCITNAGLLPVVEKRKGSFFSVRKWRTEKGNGKFLAEWFHISPWEVPNFRNFLVNILAQRGSGFWSNILDLD